MFCTANPGLYCILVDKAGISLTKMERAQGYVSCARLLGGLFLRSRTGMTWLHACSNTILARSIQYCRNTETKGILRRDC